jgi:hypothetical protein
LHNTKYTVSCHDIQCLFYFIKYLTFSYNYNIVKKNREDMIKKIGILRETKSLWERRTPLLPDDMKRLQEAYPVHFIIQPAEQRIVPIEAYQKAGVKVRENLSDCDILIGIKEVQLTEILANKIYLFFSHTIKGQRYNMPMLRQLLEHHCTLIDYERITDESGKRFIYFSFHAGLAGALETLWAYGQRLAHEQIVSPFIRIKRAYAYDTIDEAEQDIRTVGREILEKGLHESLLPMVFGITGYGNVSQGVQKILGQLPMQWINVDQLRSVEKNPYTIYGVIFKEADMVRPLEENHDFDLQEYYKQPQKYKAVFNAYLEHLSVLFNASYWDKIYPRHVTKSDIKTLFMRRQSNRLRIIGDISCDIEGGIACTVKSTDPGDPVYVYDIENDRAVDGIAGKGPVIMAIDILPAEVPHEASCYFSERLRQLIPMLIETDFDRPIENVLIKPMIKRAIITHHGKLTPDYRYLEEYLVKKTFNGN